MKNGLCKITVQGNLVFQDACEKQKIKELIKSKEKYIELDLTEVELLDSTGVDLIAKLFVAIKERKGRMKITNVRPEFRELLEICGLGSIVC